MKALFQFCRFFARFRYPVSLPEEVAEALGVKLSNFLSFDRLMQNLMSPGCRPTNLTRFMPRKKAEQAFQNALRKEIFPHNSLFSYYFNEGWMEFELHYDRESRLRRIYIRHQRIEQEEGFEIPLSVS